MVELETHKNCIEEARLSLKRQMPSEDQSEKQHVTNEPKHCEEITITTNANPIDQS